MSVASRRRRIRRSKGVSTWQLPAKKFGRVKNEQLHQCGGWRSPLLATNGHSSSYIRLEGSAESTRKQAVLPEDVIA